jgi:hypothetical protein
MAENALTHDPRLMDASKIDSIRRLGAFPAPFTQVGKDIVALCDHIGALNEHQERLVKGLQPCVAHLEELAEAWKRGAIHELDTTGGARSNRNWDVLVQLHAALAELGEETKP